jgi:hypothetical protein
MHHELFSKMYYEDVRPRLAHCVHHPKGRRDWTGNVNEAYLHLCNCLFARDE